MRFYTRIFLQVCRERKKRELLKGGNLKNTLSFSHKSLILCLQFFYDVKDLYSNIALTENLRNYKVITLKGHSDLNVFASTFQRKI